MTIGIILFIFISVLWAFIKEPVWKWKLTIAMLLSPAFFMAIYEGYAYASSLALALTLTTMIYNFNQTSYIIKTRTLYAIPFIIFIIYLTNNMTVQTTGTTGPADILIAIIVICLSLFVTGVGTILALTRNRGEDLSD